MEDIVLVCGRWKFDRSKWVFCFDEQRGRIILSANGGIRFEDFLEMVYEDFRLDSRIYSIKLSYMLSEKKKSSNDTPLVVVSNGRQLQAYLR